MKKVRGLLAVVLAVAVVCTSFITVSAKSFRDVDADKYSWCAKEIEAMADDNIISGYTDGTFKPENTVTKLEALALVARVLGSRDDINATLLEKAKELYGEKVSEYKLSFGDDEVCYLLLKGILTEKELPDYIAGDTAGEGMKRYEVAILLTKAMGAEDAVKEKVTAVLDYSDTLQIPATARKYVEHVTTVGLMKGVSENTFAPLTDVNRAQAAVLLYRLRDLNNYETFRGLVTSYDHENRTIRFKINDTNKAYTLIPSAVTLRCDGEEIEAEDIASGWEAIVTVQSDMLHIVDFLSAQSDGTVAGKLLSVTKSGDDATLKVQTSTSTKTTVSYKTAGDVVVTYNDKDSALSKISVGDYVKLTIQANKIVAVNAYPPTQTVKGTVTAINLIDGITLTVMVDGEEEIYDIDSNVKVAKNDKTSKMAEILIGDKVTLKLDYNVITNIDATSTTVKDSGIVQAIITEATGTVLRIKIGTQAYEYPVARDAEIVVNGINATVHDLRINNNVTFKLESDTIVSLSTTAAADDTELKGVVERTNSSYNLIVIKYTDPTTGTEIVEQVFLKNNARIISTSSTTDKKFKDIQIGQTINAMGSRATGDFEATTIIIRD